MPVNMEFFLKIYYTKMFHKRKAIQPPIATFKLARYRNSHLRADHEAVEIAATGPEFPLR
jgi:hypothetical protein